jgi:hypothetical protein
MAGLVTNYLEDEWVREGANHPCLSPSLAYVPCTEKCIARRHIFIHQAGELAIFISK